jgi:transcriptional regulator with XRE-family HTH domain
MERAGRNGGRRRFGLRLVSVRRRLALPQEALSTDAGISRSYLSGVENGRRNLGLDNIYKLADALGILPLVLLDLDRLTDRASRHVSEPSAAYVAKRPDRSRRGDFLAADSPGGRTVRFSLAAALSRATEFLRGDYLRPLVAEGEVALRYPGNPSHPQQAHIATTGRGASTASWRESIRSVLGSPAFYTASAAAHPAPSFRRHRPGLLLLNSRHSGGSHDESHTKTGVDLVSHAAGGLRNGAEDRDHRP